MTTFEIIALATGMLWGGLITWGVWVISEAVSQLQKLELKRQEKPTVCE